MRFIRSKGHSYTHASEISEISEVRPLKRSLVVTRRQTVGNKEPIQENLSHYAKTDPDLLIRQYISAIDKVISKPTEIGRFTETKTEIQAVTEDWYSHREALGASCWTLLEKRLRDTGLENTVLASLRPTWRWKLHPYAVEETANEDIVRIRRNFKAAEKRAGKEKKHFKPIYKKGRWYDVFWALDASGNPDFPTIAEKISRHLFEQEITLGPKPARVGPVEQKPRQGRDKKVSGIGLIEKRASSIESSVYPSASDVGKLAADWSSADEEKYSKGDIAPKIFGIAKAKEEKRGRLTTSDVGKLLYQNYADVELNKHHNVAENEEFKGLLALHQAVKEFYKSKIRTSKRGRDDAQGKLSEVLPRNNKKLFELLVQQDENGHINNLIRQGRNVFYQTMAAAAHTTTGTPLLPNIDFATHFRTSNGQAEIKRSEAFVRVWRSVISQAGRTAKAWADPDGAKGDVFEEQPIQDLTGNLFNQTNYRAKLDVLFGDKAECFKSNRSIDESNVLQAALRIGQRLRRVAHFYDRKSFVKEIEGSIKQDETTDSTKVSIQKLVNTDWADLDKRLIDDLEGVRLHDFSDSKQIEQLIDELKSPDVGDIALPRFNRLLDGLDGIRAKIIDKKDFRLSLPKRVNTRTEPSTLCKFACMKRLYERPFRPWLESIHACELQKMINQVRTEGALRAQDTLSSNPFKNLIRSKAENLPDLGDRKLVGYFDDLAREVAIENRHQNAYEPNPEAAREQSEWIEDFKCNLLAIAFVRYLNEKRFSWLLQLPHEPRNGSKPGTYPDQKSATVVTFAAWEANLYFFLHLVPIDDVARLIHQLRKTAVLDRKATEDTDSSVKRLQDLLSLYMDMHDAKFDGTAVAIGLKDFRDLFEKPEDFDQIYNDGSANDHLVMNTARGLRQIMRFGHLPVLETVFAANKVSGSDVNGVLEKEKRLEDGKSKIEVEQSRRDDLHTQLNRKKARDLTANDSALIVEYRGLVNAISDHRNLASRVRLTDHVRLHQIMVRVLARLMDYAGVWERDWLFVYLGLLEVQRAKGQCGPEKVPEGFPTAEGLGRRYTAKGRGIFKLSYLTEVNSVLFSKHFHGQEGALQKIRNDLAHFNILNHDRLPLDLTAQINLVRTLMAYDRKLKNAVSKSIRELLEREGITVTWHMGEHNLSLKGVTSKKIQHLKKAQAGIVEPMHSETFVSMVRRLFDDQHPKSASEGG